MEHIIREHSLNAKTDKSKFLTNNPVAMLQLITEAMDNPSNTIHDGNCVVYYKTFAATIGTTMTQYATKKLKVVTRNGILITAYPV